VPLRLIARLGDFTELLSTAIARTESRDALARLAAEQAALRRVATLVAGTAPSGELFAAVVKEVGGLLPVTSAAMVRFDPDGLLTTVATWSVSEVVFQVGSRWVPEGKNVAAIVFREGRPARLDDFSDASGAIGLRARESGCRSAVGTPIIVEGRLWGIITAASTTEEPLPPDTERRLEQFTQLVATAIANTESRDALQRLADEQAALRRVAVLVAQRTPTDQVFGAVVAEVARLLPISTAAMGRFDPDGLVTTVAAWSEVEVVLPIGRRWAPEGENVTTRVFRTGAAARIDDFSKVSGPLGERARPVGYQSAVGCPITVEGRLWGVIATASVAEESLPPDTEKRLESFTDLVATAIANADARGEIERLADEQAALRRVATLVARDAPATEVFDAVATEVGRLLDTDITILGRYDGNGGATAIGNWSASPGGVPIGTRTRLGGRNVLTMVAETG
jgi:GAF domain-containing protein